MAEIIYAENLPNGLYLVERSGFPFDHRVILDIGNTSGQFSEPMFCDLYGIPKPSVIHMDKKEGLCRLTFEVYCKKGGNWTIIEEIPDTRAAVKRIYDYVENNGINYKWLRNNCEHFANFVAYGEKKSPQLRGWGTVAAFAGVALLGSLQGND